MLPGLIYLHLQTADKKFQQKISFGIYNEALQFVDGSLFPLVRNILNLLGFFCTVPGLFGHSTSVAILPAMNHDYVTLI